MSSVDPHGQRLLRADAIETKYVFRCMVCPNEKHVVQLGAQRWGMTHLEGWRDLGFGMICPAHTLNVNVDGRYFVADPAYPQFLSECVRDPRWRLG